MRATITAIAIALGLSVAVPVWAAPEKYTWDGHGGGKSAKCPTYPMHIELVADGGKVTGWWQQKGRTVRKFDFAVGADGGSAGPVSIEAGVMNVKGNVGADPAIALTGYCDFGGKLKKN